MTDASLTSEPEKLLPGQHWQHVKRGTTYEVIGLGELQMQSDLVDGSSLVIYRGDDGKLWAREEGEFLDGRFRLSASPSTPIPVIAEAGEREGLSWRLERIIEDGGPLTLSDKAILREVVAALSTPATLDNTAAEDDEYMSVSIDRSGVVTSHNAYDADFDEMVTATQAIISALQARLDNRLACPFAAGKALLGRHPLDSGSRA